VQERINLKWAVPATIVGVGIVIGGLVVGRFSRATVAEALISLGVALALVGVLVFLERHMLREVSHVAASAASDAVENQTADLRERMSRLEDLDEAQVRAREERKRRSDQLIDRLKEANLDHPRFVGDLLLSALTDKLFDGATFHVRTSADAECPVLYMVPLVSGTDVIGLWLAFEQFDQFQHMKVEGVPEPIVVPVNNGSGAMWVHGTTAGEVAGELESKLEQRNEPRHSFSLAFALERLAQSVLVMRDARAADAGSPQRLRGALVLLINDQWAITSEGLESLASEAAAYPISLAHWGSDGTWQRQHLKVSSPRPSESSAEWREASSWMEDREYCEIVSDDPL
jgi:hypothetical protein